MLYSLGVDSTSFPFYVSGVSTTQNATFVLDGASDQIRKYNRDGRLVVAAGREGRGPGEFDSPIGIATTDSFVIVTEQRQPVLHIFDHSLAFVRDQLLDILPFDVAALADTAVFVSGYSRAAADYAFVRRYALGSSESVDVMLDTPDLPAAVRETSVGARATWHIGIVDASGDSWCAALLHFNRIRCERGGQVVWDGTAAASGGSYLDMRDTGTIEFDGVTVPANGVYWLVFGYNLNYDVPKHQDIIVNGDTLANLRFNGAPQSWRRRAVKVALNAGPNEIVISPVWGWMYFDYIDVSPDAVGTAVDPDASLTDERDALDVNFPNPFRGETTIGYSIGARTHVTVEVFDVVGRRVATLVDAVLSAGSHTVTFDGSNLAGGVYYFRLTTEAGVVARQMVVLP